MKVAPLLRVLLILVALATGARAAGAVVASTTPTVDPVLARVFPSIVRIEAIRLRPNEGRLTKQWSGGSGVVISAEGHVVTNCHVTDDGDYFRCDLFDGSHVDARLVGQDPLTDLAVLQLDLSQRAPGAPPLVVTGFGDSDALHAGDVVFALGSPGFLAQSATRGIISNPSLVLPEQTAGRMVLRGENVGTLVRWILHDAQIYGGNSGGPLVNDRGEIVGINEIGVFNLSGAIPGNLARGIAGQLMKQGRVIRGWSGITVQARLEADAASEGVAVSDVAEGSPAALAGLQAGDVIVECDQAPINDGEEKAVAHFNRIETGKAPEAELEVAYLRAGQKHHAVMKLVAREPAQARDVELRSWGAVVRDLTRSLVRDEHLPDSQGVWIENIRPAGPSGQAEPMLRHGDVLIAVDGDTVRNVEDLQRITSARVADQPGKPHPVTASYRREGNVLQSVVELRETSEHNVTQQARKAWLGISSQPLTSKLRARLKVPSAGGARVTRVHPETEAAKAGIRVGDVIVAVDGVAVEARRAEDTDVLPRQIRQYRVASTVTLAVWRDGAQLALPVRLEAQPTPPAEMPWWEDTELEFTAHDLAFDDHVRLQLPGSQQGVLVESAEPAGWAALGGLRSDDVILAVAGTPVTSVAELRTTRAAAAQRHAEWWVLLVRRDGQTLLVEISLKAARNRS